MFYFSWKNSISSPTGPLQKATRTGNSGWDGITMSFGSTVIGYPASRTAFTHPSTSSVFNGLKAFQIAKQVHSAAAQEIWSKTEEKRSIKMGKNILKRLIDNLSGADLRRVRKDPMEIMGMEHPSEAAQLYVVRQNPEMIQFIGTPSEKVQLD